VFRQKAGDLSDNKVYLALHGIKDSIRSSLDLDLGSEAGRGRPFACVADLGVGRGALAGFLVRADAEATKLQGLNQAA